MMARYHLIDLPCDGTNYTVVVSEKWLLLPNLQCYYPPTDEKLKLMKFLRDHCPPDPITWPLYNKIVLRTRPYVSLEKAWRDIDPAIENTDFQQSDESEEEECSGRSRRKIKQRQIYSPQAHQRKKQGAAQESQDHNILSSAAAVIYNEPVMLSDVPVLSFSGSSDGSVLNQEQIHNAVENSHGAGSQYSCYSATTIPGTYQHSNPQNLTPAHPQRNYQEGNSQNQYMDNTFHTSSVPESSRAEVNNFSDITVPGDFATIVNPSRVQYFQNLPPRTGLPPASSSAINQSQQADGSPNPASGSQQFLPQPIVGQQLTSNFTVPVPARTGNNSGVQYHQNLPPRTGLPPASSSTINQSQQANGSPNQSDGSQQFLPRPFVGQQSTSNFNVPSEPVRSENNSGVPYHQNLPPRIGLPPVSSSAINQSQQANGSPIPSGSQQFLTRSFVGQQSTSTFTVPSEPIGTGTGDVPHHQNHPPRTESVPLNRSTDLQNRSLVVHTPNASSSFFNESDLLSGARNDRPSIPIGAQRHQTGSLSLVPGSSTSNAVTDEILERLREQSKLIDELLKGSNRVCTPRSTTFDEILPLDTMAKFLDFEQCLVREENRKDFVSIIQSIGGKSLNDVVVRAMEQIVKDCVAKDINWEGELRKGVQKHSFRKSKIKTVLFDTLKPAFGGKSFYDMEVCVKNWLRHAPKRYTVSLESARTPRRRRR